MRVIALPRTSVRAAVAVWDGDLRSSLLIATAGAAGDLLTSDLLELQADDEQLEAIGGAIARYLGTRTTR